MSKLKTAFVMAIAAATATIAFVLQHQAQLKMREENQALRQRLDELAPLTTENARLSNLLTQAESQPAPSLPSAPSQAPSEPVKDAPRGTNLIALILSGKEPPKLTASQVESYLKENRRNAGSLLAAFRTTGDPALLQEAMEKHPADPRVAFAAMFKKDAPPEERRQWLEALKQSATENALGNYLAASDAFKSGQTDRAVQELAAGSAKPGLHDYATDSVQDDEEAYRAAGYSVAEAKTISTFSMLLPHMVDLKQMGENTVALANSYRQSGDEASAQLALQMGLDLGRRFEGDPSEPLIAQLVGVSIERNALSAMDPATPYGSAGQNVKDRLDEMSQQRSMVRQLAQQFDAVQPQVSEQDWISYKDRWRVSGEEAAMRWVIAKYGQ